MKSTRASVVAAALAVFAGSLVSGLATPIAGQDRPMAPTTKANGTVKGIRGDVIHVVNEEGDQYMVKLPNRPQQVTYNGSATAGFLANGMFVRFQGKFDMKGNAAEPISRLEVFTPQPPTRGRNPLQGEEDPNRLGVFPDVTAGAGELFADLDATKKPAEEYSGFRIAGRITGGKNGKLMVAAGNAAIQVPVAEDAQVSISVNDWRWMQVGDSVLVEGWANPQQVNQIVAMRIEITGSQPLGVTESKPTRGTRGAKPVGEKEENKEGDKDGDKEAAEKEGASKEEKDE